MKYRIIEGQIPIKKSEDDLILFYKLKKKYGKSFFMKFPSFHNRNGEDFTLMVLHPKKEYTVKKNGFVKIKEGDTESTLSTGDPLDLIKRAASNVELVNENEFDTPFKGGVIGYLSYDYYHRYLNKKVDVPDNDPIQIPVAVFLWVDKYLLYNHAKNRLTFYAIRCEACEEENYAVDHLTGFVEVIKAVVSEPIENDPLIHNSNVQVPERDENYETNLSKPEYFQMIKNAKHYLKKGDIKQIVLSQRFRLLYRADGFYLFHVLNKINLSRYMFYLNFDSYTIMGASPETHCICNGDKIELNMLAGTQKRGTDKEEDARIADSLNASSKMQDEHQMLIQADIEAFSAVSEPGSTRILENSINVKYGFTQYLSSFLEAKLRDIYDVYDILKHTFPRGVVVGSPKEAAMKIISELEPENRSFYAGIVFTCNFSGTNLDSGIMIITSLLKEDALFIQCGGGILIDSEAESEYNETLYKAMAHMKAAGAVKSVLGIA